MDAVTERGARLGHLKTRMLSKIHIDQQGGACYTSRKGAIMMYTKEMQTRKKKKRMKHPKSLLHEKNGTCYLCMQLNNNHKRYLPLFLEKHHIFGGPNRNNSEEYGLVVWLCMDHHTMSPLAVHNCPETAMVMHQIGQRAFEETHSRQQFIDVFGKSYL